MMLFGAALYMQYRHVFVPVGWLCSDWMKVMSCGSRFSFCSSSVCDMHRRFVRLHVAVMCVGRSCFSGVKMEVKWFSGFFFHVFAKWLAWIYRNF